MTRPHPLAFALLLGCSAPVDTPPDTDAAVTCNHADAATQPDGRVVGGPYATRVVSFTPGPGATFGHDQMPDIVLGPPRGTGDAMGSFDVVSLGERGEIILGFDQTIVDGPGADFTVFENAFRVPGAADRRWVELAEVSVSPDGATWTPFPCATTGTPPYPGCAGWEPVYAGEQLGFCALDPRVSGGEGFDLATIGVTSARFVRIRDLATQGRADPSTGFDLDAVAVLHGR